MVALSLSDEGFDALTAADGIEALDRLRAARCGIVLVDLRMPRMNGLEFLAAVKRDGALAAIPIVVITGDALAVQPIAAGAAACLVKPVDAADIVASVRRFSAQAA